MYNQHLNGMVRTLTRQATYVSTKVDERERTVYTFEIDEAQYNELQELVEMSHAPDCYKCWYKLESSADPKAVTFAPDVFQNENDGKCFLRFNKTDISPMPVLEKGRQCTVVYGVRWFKTKDIYGFSCTLNSII